MFGTASQQTAPGQGGSGLFGGLGNNNQQTGSGLFGGSTNNQQTQQQSTGLFGQPQNQQQQQGTSSLFGQPQSQTQQQATSSLFGQSQNQQQPQATSSLFGQPQNQQQSGGFGGLGLGLNTQPQPGGAFGLGQNNQQSNQQQGGGLFQNSTQQNPLAQSLPGPLGSSLWAVNSGISPREKTIPEQMAAIMEQWDTGNPNCKFRHYFYNKVSAEHAPYYRPSPNEDAKKWEEALAQRPGPGFVPVLCTGFAQMGERIQTQQKNLTEFNVRLHEINNCLSHMLQNHDTRTSIRAMDAKRKHIVLKQRCLALATKVQVLRNRGYAMGGAEEDLRAKLLALEKNISDPGMGARSEEIWARMITVQERARLLKAEIDKSGSQDLSTLDEDTEKRAKKILEDYQTQLVHLKKELDKVQEDYVAWQKDQNEESASQTSKSNASGR